MTEFQGPGVDKLGVTPIEKARIQRFLLIADRILGVLSRPTASHLLIERDMAELRGQQKTIPEKDGE